AIDTLQQQDEVEGLLQLDDDRRLVAAAGDQVAAADLRLHGIALAFQESLHRLIEVFFAGDGHARESTRRAGVDASLQRSHGTDSSASTGRWSEAACASPTARLRASMPAGRQQMRSSAKRGRRAGKLACRV